MSFLSILSYWIVTHLPSCYWTYTPCLPIHTSASTGKSQFPNVNTFSQLPQPPFSFSFHSPIYCTPVYRQTHIKWLASFSFSSSSGHDDQWILPEYLPKLFFSFHLYLQVPFPKFYQLLAWQGASYLLQPSFIHFYIKFPYFHQNTLPIKVIKAG